MATLTFDTYEAVKRLTDSGLDEQQAKAVTETIKAAQNAHLEELATKGDIALLRKDIEMLRKDMEMMRKDIIITLVSIITVVGAVILAYLEFRGG